MYCSKCGKQIPDNINFCPYCGCFINSKKGVESIESPPNRVGYNYKETENKEYGEKSCSIIKKGVILKIILLIVCVVTFLFACGISAGTITFIRDENNTKITNKTVKSKTTKPTESADNVNNGIANKIPDIKISGQKLYDDYNENIEDFSEKYLDKKIAVVAVMRYKNGEKSTKLTLRCGFKDIDCFCIDDYSAESTIRNNTPVLVYGICKFDDKTFYIDDCYYVEETTDDILLALTDSESQESESKADVKSHDYSKLSEDEYKAQCQELWHDDIFFSKDDLTGKLVKLDLFLEENKMFSADSAYNIMTTDFTNEFDLQREFYECGVQREKEFSYMGGQITLYFSNSCGYSASDMRAGDHLVVYGQIIEYSRSTWDGYNKCSVLPRFIENNGQ